MRIARRHWLEVYDGTTVNRTALEGTADILTWLFIPNSADGRDGTGACGICFGLDVTGDGVGELYAMRGFSNSTGGRLNVWNPVTMTRIASYNMDGIWDDSFMILGPDLNGDDTQDLWVADVHHSRLVAINCTTGAILSTNINLVDAKNPDTVLELRYPQHISYGPADSILVSTRFASSLDKDWKGGGGNMPGGDLLQIKWDSVNQHGLVTLLFEHTGRLSGAVYVPN